VIVLIRTHNQYKGKPPNTKQNKTKQTNKKKIELAGQLDG